MHGSIDAWQSQTCTGYLCRFMPWHRNSENNDLFDYAMINASSRNSKDDGHVDLSWLNNVCDDAHTCGMMSADGIVLVLHFTTKQKNGMIPFLKEYVKT